MNRRMLLLLFCLTLSTLWGSGCASSPDKKDATLTEDAARYPAFFNQIPAQAPYVMTSLKPFPLEVMEPYLRMYGDLTAQTRQQLENSGLNAGSSDSMERLVLAMLDELSTVNGLEGYEQLGFSSRPHMAIYGIGWFPVMRITLGDTEAFKAMLDRLDQKSGLTPQMRTLGKTTYRQYGSDTNDIKVALAVTDGQLIVGGAPTKVFDEFIGYMLGEKKVGRSLADVTTMQDIQAQYELTPYAVGYVDIAGIAQAASGAAPGDPVTAAMLKAMNYQADGLSEVCRHEIIGLAEGAPRAIFGYTTLTAELMEVKSVLEISGTFAQELAAISAPIPGNNDALINNAFFAVGLGIDMKKAVDFLNIQANRINNAPFECPEFASANEWARDVPNTLAMVPPIVTSLRGVFALLTEMDMNTGSMEGLALLHTSDPMGLFSQMRQFIPQLQSVQVKPDGVPVALPPIAGVPQLDASHLVMNQNTLGASVGPGTEARLVSLLNQAPQPGASEDPLVLIAYNYGEFMRGFMAGMMGGMQGNDPSAKTLEMMSEILGTFVIEVSARDHGIEMNYRITMHPDRIPQSAQPEAAP